MGEMMTPSEIINEVNKYKAAQIVLTGGEPSLFIDENLINQLKQETNLKIAIETNGTHPLPSGIDWVTVSPKIGMSPIGKADIYPGVKADELKVVDIGQDLEPYFELSCVQPSTVMLLQPCHVENSEENEKNTRRTIQRVLDDSRWRLSLQTHRYIGLP